MDRIPAAQAAAFFEQIIGWPYQSPGVTDDRGSALGIDCSGAWVRVYRRFGKFLEHGSNSQFRRFCGETGRIGDASALRVGMAVFKCRPWREEDRGHRDYGAEPGNLYHVGCVTRADPLRIVHATPPAAKADASAEGWTHWGWLKQVDCPRTDAGAPKDSKGRPESPLESRVATVTTQSGSLYLRKHPDLEAPVVKAMPPGTAVELLGAQPGWARVRYLDPRGMPHIGWCAGEYLTERPKEENKT